MTYDDLVAGVLEIDPDATEYYRLDDGGTAQRYTVIVPTREYWELSDDGIEEAVLTVQINHYSLFKDRNFLRDFINRFMPGDMPIDDPIREWDPETGLHRLIITVQVYGLD